MKISAAIPTILLLSTLATLAQGYVNFSTRVSGTVVGHVYAERFWTFGKNGNTASETPAGTQTYTGIRITGSGFSAQLFAVNGADQPEQLLLAVSAPTPFRTGAILGGTPAPLVVRIPFIPAGGTGTFQIRVWDNFEGTITSWDAGVYRGKSALFNVSNLGDGILTLPANMENFRSFSFYDPRVPEPGTLTLLGLAGLGFWLARRRNPSA